MNTRQSSDEPPVQSADGPIHASISSPIADETGTVTGGLRDEVLKDLVTNV